MKQPSISVVIPVYNSGKSLLLLCERLLTVLPELTQRFEIILVDDGSRDDSPQVIAGLTARYPQIHGITLMRNYGQHNALLCGIRAARCALIVTMDDDLQHPPEMIAPLLDRLSDDCDVIYGVPLQEQHGLWRDLASQATKLVLAGTMGATAAREAGAFRLFRTRLRDAFADYRSPLVSIDVLLTWATTRFASVRVRHEPRRYGQSTYTIGKLITHAFTLITGFSTLPLRVAGIVGIGCALFGVLVLVYVLGRYLIEGGSVAGFPFLASVIAIFSGAQLFALGIFGEYLARIYFRTMDRPVYTVREQSAVEREDA